MSGVPAVLASYHASSKPLSCELDAQPYICEFWPLEDLSACNADYEVERYAPGYFGFGTSGGGEMFTIAPDGRIVCLAFIGMSPTEELHVADSWPDFERLLRCAL